MGSSGPFFMSLKTRKRIQDPDGSFSRDSFSDFGVFNVIERVKVGK